MGVIVRSISGLLAFRSVTNWLIGRSVAWIRLRTMTTMMAVSKEVDQRTREYQHKGQPAEILEEMRPMLGHQIKAGDPKEQPERKVPAPGSRVTGTMRPGGQGRLRGRFMWRVVHCLDSESGLNGPRRTPYLGTVASCRR